MSGGMSGVQWLRVQTHTGTSVASGDVAASPANLDFLDPQEIIDPNCPQNKVDVRLQSDDGESSTPDLGTKSGGGFSCSFLARGDDTAAGDGNAASGGELAQVLASYFGNSSAATGDVTSTGHSTTVITTTATAGFGVRNAMIIDSAPGADVRYEAREIASVSANTSWTLERALQGVPDDAAVAYAMMTYEYDPDDTVRSAGFLQFLLERENWYRRFDGCAVKLSLAAPPGGLAKWQCEVMANDWADVAETNPTYAATVGTAALNVTGSPFFLGATKTELIDFSLEFNLEPQPRMATEGPNGQNGWIITPGSYPTWKGRIYGNDTTLATMQGDNTLDLMMQIGDTSSAATQYNCIMVRAPAVSVGPANIVQYNGVDAIEFEGRCCRPAAGGAVRVHVGGYAG